MKVERQNSYDIMYYTPELALELGSRTTALTPWWRQALTCLFRDFPDLAGVIMRFGEADSTDVRQTFRSALVLRTPRTFDRAFGSLSSPQLILSMKYGETDFFRFLPLNPLFYRGSHRKMIEFQARREYEGFGEFPAFVGWEHERYIQALQQVPNVVRASVWCQTGGWGKFRRRTYLEDSSIWVELNAFVTAQLCRGASCEEAVRQFGMQLVPAVDLQPFLQFLRLADDVIQELLYGREMAEQTLFFRRLRVPPLLHVYWDRMLINPLIRTVLRTLVRDHQGAINQGWDALQTIKRMQQLAETHGIPRLGLQFQYDTFEILAALREYVFGEPSPAIVAQLKTLKRRYRAAYRWRYAVKIRPFNPSRQLHYLPLLLTLALRRQRHYRLVDHLLFLRLPALIYPLLRYWRPRLFPKYARKSGMGIDVVLK